MIRFLFDECLSPSLVSEAHARGYDASHVNFLGLGGFRDRALLPVIQNDDWTFVTNNRRDFLKLYRNLEIHAGLLIILPAATAAVQMALFVRALAAIEPARTDLIGQLVEVDETGEVTIRAWPFDGDNRP